MNTYLKSALWAVTVLLFAACGGGETDSQTKEGEKQTEQSLSEWELENGIGPVKEPVELGDETDDELVGKGRDI